MPFIFSQWNLQNTISTAECLYFQISQTDVYSSHTQQPLEIIPPKVHTDEIPQQATIYYL